MTNKTELPLKLYKKISSIIAKEIVLPKTGYNKHHDYYYLTEKDIIDTMRTHLINNSIHLVMKELDISNPEDRITRVTYEFTLIDLETGDFDVTHMSGDGYDSTDKGVYKACTGALKYFLLRTFMIASEDDPEKDSNTEEKPKQQEEGSFKRSGRFNRNKKED